MYRGPYGPLYILYIFDDILYLYNIIVDINPQKGCKTMARLWTLAKHKHGGCKEILNGKIMLLRKFVNSLDEETLRFIDATNNNVLWETSKVVQMIDYGNTLNILTNNDTFILINVESIIPTGGKFQLDCRLFREEHQPIRHGLYSVDGYDEYTYKFNRNINREEFIEWCMQHGHTVHKARNSWDDHSEITGNENIWTYKWIRVYTHFKDGVYKSEREY